MTLIELDEATITLTNLQPLCWPWIDGEILIEDMFDEICNDHTVRQLTAVSRLTENTN